AHRTNPPPNRGTAGAVAARTNSLNSTTAPATWNPPGLSRTYVEDLMHRIAQHPTDSDPDMDEALRRVREGR
ncbi:hypothetical protein ACWGVR_29280, partial [Streptomyces xanthophaeus]